jgi:hypothetical protein
MISVKHLSLFKEDALKQEISQQGRIKSIKQEEILLQAGQEILFIRSY